MLLGRSFQPFDSTITENVGTKMWGQNVENTGTSMISKSQEETEVSLHLQESSLEAGLRRLS